MPCDSETLWLRQVESRLRAVIPKVVPMVGSDDTEELVQDGLVIALRLYRGAQAAGKTVTPGNLAFYTVQGERFILHFMGTI